MTPHFPEQTGLLDADPSGHQRRSSRKLRVGVLTFHRCINYGTYWQARLLLEGLAKRGHDVRLINHTSSRIFRAEWKCALQPVLPSRVTLSDRFRYAVKMLRQHADLEALQAGRAFPLEQPSRMPECDVAVVGSDEVWNLSHPWFGGSRLFFGEGIRADRRISYAASFGNYASAGGLAAEWRERLRRFDLISVRDFNSRDIVTSAIGTEPDLVLDPCLQFPLSLKFGRSPFQRPTLVVYGHNFSAKFAEQIRKTAAENHWDIVSVGYRNDFARRQWLTASPSDFLHAIRHAAAVATNFFHGCVFSLRFEKPFVTELSPYRSVKIRDLVRQFDLPERVLEPGVSADRIHSCLKSPPQIRPQLEQLRREGFAFLQNAGL